MFTIGDVRQCYSVQIVDDDFCDPELFFSNLELLSGAPVIIVNPDRAQVVIQDSDCGKKHAINNTNLVLAKFIPAYMIMYCTYLNT